LKWDILAGLRFFLALIVVADHLLDIFPNTGEPWRLLNRFGGFSAVIGFLLVSGYSIASSISRKPEGFYKRRFFRIYPLYVCSILVSLIPFSLAGTKLHELANGAFITPNAQSILGNLFLMQGFLVKYIPSNPALWTLSIECFCYLLAPFLIKLRQKSLLILIGLSSILFALCPYYIQYIHKTESSSGYDHYDFYLYGIGFILLFWAWLLGFFYFFHKDRPFSKILLISLGCILLEQNQIVSSRWAISTYVLSALVLIYSPYISFPKFASFASNVLKYLGELSYPLYLFHVPSILFLYSVLDVKDPIKLIGFALTISALFYYSVDNYFRSGKTRSKRCIYKEMSQS
jgi:peptidoglycan/LPS O-acetylase OafA/YrhL